MKLEAADIRFSYDDTPVLSDVSFSLERGRIMCILGVNGAGKSTLLKCMNRILKLESGSVFIDGEDLTAMSRKSVARRMGYVPQTQHETNLSVFETILMGRKPHIKWIMTEEDYEVVEKIINELEIEHLAMRPVSELSGGEAQKVAIARALAQSPKVLLLDEPTSNLDLKNQLEVMGLIRTVVSDQGLSAVIALHDLNVALRFADRFLFLKDQEVYSATDRQGLDPEIIRDVYGVEVELREIGGHKVVVPL